MTSLDPGQEADLLIDVGRELVEETAPEEIPLYEANAKAYLEDPAEYEKQRTSDDMLGFGVGEAVVMVTPVAIACLRKVMDFLVDEVLDESQKQGSTMIRDAIKRFFGRFKEHGPEADVRVSEPTSTQVMRLSPDQLASVREMVLTHAKRLRVPDTKAVALADATVARLAV